MAQVNSPWPGYDHEESPNGTPISNLSSSQGGRFAFSTNSPSARNSPLLSVNEKRRRLTKKMNDIDSRIHELETEGKTAEEISNDDTLFTLMKEYVQLKARLGVVNNNNNNNSNAEDSSNDSRRRKSRKNRKDKKGSRKNTRRH